jgi:hypothetical protein
MLEQLTSEPALRYVMIGFIVLCAVMGFLRGIGRLVLFGLALAAGLAAALAWFRYMPALCISWFQTNPPEFVQWGAIAAGLTVAWLARRFLNALVHGGEPPDLDRSTRVRGGVLGLVPALVMVWAGAVAMRWAGAASRLQHLEQAVDALEMKPLEAPGLVARVGRSLSDGVLGDILNRLDPMNSRETGAAGTLLVLQRNDAVWHRTVRHPFAGPVVLLPSFDRLRDDKDVLHALSFSHYSRLLTLPELDSALDDRPLREALLNLDFDALLPELITGKHPAVVPRAVPVPDP